MDKISYEPGSFYIFDRGYLDFERMYFIHQSKSFFVIRAKNNLKFKRIYSAAVDKATGIRCDQTGTLKGYYSLQGYPEKIRRIKFYDKEQNRTFVFLTNNVNLKATEIATSVIDLGEDFCRTTAVGIREGASPWMIAKAKMLQTLFGSKQAGVTSRKELQ
jgi:hypothetical protein